MRDTIVKDVVQESWNIGGLRAFGYPVFPEMVLVNSESKAERAELFKELEIPNKRRVQQHWHWQTAAHRLNLTCSLFLQLFQWEHVHLHITYGCICATVVELTTLKQYAWPVKPKTLWPCTEKVLQILEAKYLDDRIRSAVRL